MKNNSHNNNFIFSICGFNVKIKNRDVLLCSDVINDCLDDCAPIGTLSKINFSQVSFPVEAIPIFTRNLQSFLDGDDLNDFYFKIGDDEIKISFYRNLLNQPMLEISSKRAQELYPDLLEIISNEFKINFSFILNYETIPLLINNLNSITNPPHEAIK